MSIFSCKLRKAVEEVAFQGVMVARNSPQVSHLFFVDDNLLFCRINKGDYHKVVEILKAYELASRQMLNHMMHLKFINLSLNLVIIISVNNVKNSNH